ncbi:MAG: SIMPL domain-containing protein [Candidatus Eremiobacteraeota bacterium]|nr:SIMPL domain-containing protein [Candidatus Eremiobacteraeota bacterium]
MKKTLVLLALAFSPVAVGAQAAAPLRAVQPAGSNGRGITVNGSSVLRIPASSARITLDVSSTNNQGSLNVRAASAVITVGAAVAGMNNVRLNSARVELKNGDCAKPLANARANAIDAAHEKAALIAKQLGVSLGPVINAGAFDQVNTDGSCMSQYFVGPMGAQFPPGSDNTDADYVTVAVTSNVTITYGIK